MIIRILLLLTLRKKVEITALTGMFILITLVFTISDLVVILTFDEKRMFLPIKYKIFRNHFWIELIHFLSEIASIILIFCSIPI